MSKHNTMTSNISEMMSQQQQNLQHLHSLQKHTRSLTDYTNTYLQTFQQQQQQQQAMYGNSQPIGTPGTAPQQQQSYLDSRINTPVNGNNLLSPQQQQQQQIRTLSGTFIPNSNTSNNTNNNYVLTPSSIQQNANMINPMLNTINQNMSTITSLENPNINNNNMANNNNNNNNNINNINNINSNNNTTQPLSNSNTNNNTSTPYNQSIPMSPQVQKGKNSFTSVTSKYNSNNNNSNNGAATTQQKSLKDQKSPLVVLIPTSAQPTDVLAARFSAWRNVIRSIIVYLTEIASIEDEIVRQQLRLSHAVQFPFFTVENQYQPSSSEDRYTQKFFLPLGSGSVQDLPTILNQYHEALASNASNASRELTNEVIPRLEDLRRDLLVKIKEIKSLQSDFKNSCAKELQQTKQDMKHYIDSLKEARYGTPKQDPYLTKIILDKQIKKQLVEENFLHEAFDNLETSGAELEKVVVMEIQNALTIYARLLGQQSQLIFDILISKLDMGFFNMNPQYEWDTFIARDPNFLQPNLPMRNLKEITYKYQYDPYTYEIRSGYLERRSKFLKSYSKGFYVLTPNFLHEFKSIDRKKDLIPIMSLPLNDCSVTEHSKKGSQDAKFVLHGKQNGLIRRGHNWVFKADSYNSMLEWFNDIKILSSTSNYKEKYKFIQQKLNLDSEGRKLGKSEASKTAKTEASNLMTPNRNATSMDTIRSNHDLSTPQISVNIDNINDIQNQTNNMTDNLSEAVDMSTFVRSSTPKLDNQTNTNTSMSSIPDTNTSQLHNAAPNVYIQTPFSKDY
ncbi:Phosphatidylinositol 4,5-bisphosphate-binding protein SLM2 [Nakaseomyces bracarensis]|uniref:Phosphatidylinositol 4,5-bisphosphate-binding protein SLM2 n=1 Tax=Nakaseomyces bracarensis TaxID=273131 RepID=A0ABR4NR29_9SACH